MLRRHCLNLIIAAATLVPAAVQAQTAALAAAPVDKSQEIVCKREKQTGGLVKARRTYLTRQQLVYVQDTNQQFAREPNNSTMSRPGSQ